MQASSAHSVDSQEYFQLLQLPGPALDLVLQQLDQCSLACAAATCNKLCHAAPASTAQLAVRCCSQAKMDRFLAWLGQHSTSLTSLTECSVSSGWGWSDPQWRAKLDRPEDWVTLTSLPCPRLRKLHLSTLRVQLESTGGCPGVLHDCTGLTALQLEACIVEELRTAAAAIAALPELCNLSLMINAKPRRDPSLHIMVGFNAQTDKEFQPEYLQACTKLTKLCLTPSPVRHWQEQFAQLSALTNLEHLELPFVAMPKWEKHFKRRFLAF